MGRYRRVGWLRRPGAADRDAARARARRGRHARASATIASGCCRADSASGCCSRERSRRRPSCCCSTSRSTGSTARRPTLLLRVLADLRAEGVAVVMATHDLSVAHLACGRACLLNRRQLAFGPIERGAHRRVAARDLRRQRRSSWPVAARSSPCADGAPGAAGACCSTRSRRRSWRGRSSRCCSSVWSAASSACTCCCGGWRSSPRRCSTRCSPASSSRSSRASRCSLGALVAALVTIVLLVVLARRPRIDADAALALSDRGLRSRWVWCSCRTGGGFQHDLTALLFGRILAVDTRQLVETAVVTRRVPRGRRGPAQGAGAARLRPAARRQRSATAPGALDLVLNVVVALVVVAAVRALGTVLVVAFLVTPAAAARLVCRTGDDDDGGGRRVSRWSVAGWGSRVSYEASVHHGVRLASGATVVLTLTAGFALVAAARGPAPSCPCSGSGRTQHERPRRQLRVAVLPAGPARGGARRRDHRGRSASTCCCAGSRSSWWPCRMPPSPAWCSRRSRV